MTFDPTPSVQNARPVRSSSRMTAAECPDFSTERDGLPVSISLRIRTSPESAPCASDASTPASAYAPRSATRPFKPMQATQRECAERDPVRSGGPGTTDAQKRRGRERGGERGQRTGSERCAQLTVEPALPQPDELEHGGAADDR